MTDILPPPPVPGEVDLRGNDWMPLYGERLFDSETWIEASPEGRVAALRLWWQAFAKEKPAASLPNSDRLLAAYAGYGEVVRAFAKVRAQAMRGFILCSDGRWYHPVVAEIAMDAWHRRQDQQEANAAKAERQRRWRERLKALTAALREVGKAPPRGASLETLEQMARDAGVDVYMASDEIGLTRQDKTGQEIKKEEEAAQAPPNGADAPPPPRLETVEPGPDDVKSAIFGAGLAWLVKHTGSSESSSRSFLGSLIGQHGEIATATALLAAERAKPVDPRSWLKRNIGATNGQRPRNDPPQGEFGSLSPELAGISAALARRPLQPG